MMKKCSLTALNEKAVSFSGKRFAAYESSLKTFTDDKYPSLLLPHPLLSSDYLLLI